MKHTEEHATACGVYYSRPCNCWIARANPATMTDVDLRNYRGETMSLTIVNGDDTDLDNMLHAGWTVTGIVTVL